jgi:hypothetical protein
VWLGSLALQAAVGRVREHLDAGADHVAIQPYAETAGAALAQLERLAPGLLTLAAPSR